MTVRATSFDLKAELLIPNRIKTYEKIEVDFLEINATDYKAKYTHFNEIKFKSLVLFDRANLSHGVLFENCEFFEATVFKDVIVTLFDQLITTDSVSIVFKNCIFHGIVEFLGSNTQIDRSLVFERCLFEKGLNIEKIIIKTEGLKIKSCTINEKLDVFSSSFNSDISLSESTINTYIRLFGITSNYISLYKLVVSGNLNVDSCKLKNGIIFNDGSFKDNVFFTLNQTEQSGLSITGSSFEKSFEIKYFSSQQPSARGISDYYINSAKFSNGFIVRGISNLAALSPKVNEITVNISSLLIGSIVFDSLDVGILNITGYNTSAKLTFKHLEINQIKVKDLINEGGLVFTNLIASNNDWPDKTYPHLMLDSALYVDNSNLGKAQFFQTDFKSFKKIIFNNVILTEITTSNVTWFTPKQLEDEKLFFAKKNLKVAIKTKKVQIIKERRNYLLSELNSVKEIYRQLKFASQKQGDIPLSHKFQRQEMEYYKDITKYEKSKNLSEFLILYSSQSNNFGQSWVKAFCGLILFSFISYIPIGFLTSKHLNYGRYATTINDILFNAHVIFVENLKSWIVLLNPTHRIKDISESIDKFSPWVYFWDFLSRVIISYFIFQTVSAFRKFSR